LKPAPLLPYLLLPLTGRMLYFNGLSSLSRITSACAEEIGCPVVSSGKLFNQIIGRGSVSCPMLQFWYSQLLYWRKLEKYRLIWWRIELGQWLNVAIRCILGNIDNLKLKFTLHGKILAGLSILFGAHTRNAIFDYAIERSKRGGYKKGGRQLEGLVAFHSTSSQGAALVWCRTHLTRTSPLLPWSSVGQSRTKALGGFNHCNFEGSKLMGLGRGDWQLDIRLPHPSSTPRYFMVSVILAYVAKEI
jgi:hypothetical protein